MYICHSPNNTEVAVADLLDTENDKDEVVYSMRQLNHRNNFTVLMDKEVVLAASDDTGSLCPFHFMIPCKCRTVYSANNGTYADIESNAIYVSVISDDANTDATKEVQWMCQARLRFTDA